MDSATAGAEGFVQPALSMLYKHYDGDNIVDQYLNAFKTNGGLKTVVTQATIGGIMSAGSELMDARRILKSVEKYEANIDEEIDGVQFMKEDAKDSFANEAVYYREDAADATSFSKNAYVAKDTSWVKSTSELYMYYKDAYPNLSDAEIAVKMNNVFKDNTAISGADFDVITKYIFDQSNGDLEAARKIFESIFSVSSVNTSSNSFAKNFYQNNNTLAYETLNSAQKKIVDGINQRIGDSGKVTITIRDSRYITPEMLQSVDDLSKLKVRILGGFADFSGHIRPEYTASRYLERVTYTGSETMDIILRLDELKSKINLDLPYNQRAKQIFDVVSEEFNYQHAGAGSMELPKYNIILLHL